MASGSPLPAVGSRHRFAFYCDEWLRLRKTKVKEATYIKYDTALEKHIKPRLGGCFPIGITSGLIDDFTKGLLLEEKLAPQTESATPIVFLPVRMPKKSSNGSMPILHPPHNAITPLHRTFATQRGHLLFFNHPAFHSDAAATELPPGAAVPDPAVRAPGSDHPPAGRPGTRSNYGAAY